MAEIYLDHFSVNGTNYPLKDALNANAKMHRNIYRGASLGSSVTAAQWAQISAGTFDDLYVGDYWTINNVNWRIADFDYWLNNGDTQCTKHHVVIVPDGTLASAKMNNSNITTGGYTGSDFYTGNNSNTGKSTAKTACTNAFGSAHILTHRELLTNAVDSNGKASGWAWFDSDVDLMNEVMVYGTNAWSSHPGYETSSEMTQLALFQLNPELIFTRAANLWLRSVASSTYFVVVYADGRAGYAGASDAYGIRPAFGIC